MRLLVPLLFLAAQAHAAEPLANFDLTAKMAKQHVPGVSVAIVEDGRVVWAKGFGVKEAGSKDPVSPETIFQAASISKLVAASAMLQLVQMGKLDLDQDVNVKLKSWKAPDNEFTREQKVTLRRLVSHSAGMTIHGFPGYQAGSPLPTLPQILDGLPPANTKEVRVDTVPGTKWRYSGGGITVEQLLIQDVTGEPFPKFMDEMVLLKVGMKSSAYSQPLAENRRRYAATGHDQKGVAIPGKYHTYPELAAAGLWTTPTDLCKFAIEIQNAFAGKSKKLLTQKTAKEMLTVQSGHVGLGPFLEGEGDSLRFGHGGSNAGFQSILMATAAHGQAVAVMTNGDGGSELADEIQKAVALEYHWPEVPKK
jgi:CubicO group peptidase (beta-lactamase class C family)